MSGRIKQAQIVCVDTNIFIYHYQNSPHFFSETNLFFSKLAEGEISAITSIITLIELLSFHAKDTKIKEIQDAFHSTPRLTVIEVNQEIALEAAKIRRTYKIRLPDAIQLATAIYGKADIFITNDSKLQNFKDIRVILLENVMKM